MRRFNYGSFKSKTFAFIGGLNEDTNTVQMRQTDLIDCLNYEVVKEQVSGYKSIDGFERWDGTTSTIEYPAGSGEQITVAFPSEVPVHYDDNGQLIDDTERELRRSQIQQVPGNGPILWAGVYKGYLYAARILGTVSQTSVNFVRLYVALDSGWSEVTDVDGSSFSLNYYTKGKLLVAKGTLGLFANNEPILVFTSGLVTNGWDLFVIHIDTDTDPTKLATPSADSAVYISDGTNNSELVGKEITAVSLFNNRLYASVGGHLFGSKLGSPTFDNSDGTAFEVVFSSDITDLISAPGNTLVILKEKGISILKSITPSPANTYADVAIDTFSTTGKTLNRTAERLFGTVISCTEKGISTLETTSAFGDFEAANIGGRVAKTYHQIKTEILTAVSKPSTNQYYIFTENGDGLVLTFDDQKRVIGGGYFNFNRTISSVTVGYINKLQKECFIFGTTDGYVLIQHSAAGSFDGSNIMTRFKTAYYHYGSPMLQKQFIKAIFELTAQKGTYVTIQPTFNYGDINVPVGDSVSYYASGSGGIWGLDHWGQFSWVGKLAEIIELYKLGYGYNLSFSLTTSSKIHQPHVVHNVSVLYKIRNINW